MPTIKELMDALKRDPISLESFNDPVLGSDLNIYERAAYNACYALNPEHRSPLSRDRKTSCRERV